MRSRAQSAGSLATADLCDELRERARVAEPVLRDFGGRRVFHGPITTLRVFEDNALVAETLAGQGSGRVLVIDGGGSTRCALVGDRLAGLAAVNAWAVIVIHGCVRDSSELAGIDLGIRALATSPRRSGKAGEGERDVPVAFAGVTFVPGEHLYADADGIVVTAASP
jgi:regulator of ribonuclease activity A